MDSLNLISTFSEFGKLKDIDKATMLSVLEDVFRNMLIKTYETDENFDIIINPEKGDLEIWRNRTVVEDEMIEDDNLEITLSEAKLIDNTFEIGEEVAEEIKLSSFGRRSVLSLRQNLAARIMDLEKANLYNAYKDRIGEIINGEVYQVWKKEIVVRDEEGNDLVLPKDQQIPSDYFRKGDAIRAIVFSVDMRNNNPIINLSRTAPQFLERLFEIEIPEIYDGIITIKKIVRMPGDRAKVAVETFDERIDPVGACVGVNGARIRTIVRELRNESIDVINYTSNLSLLITRALSPAKISDIEIDEDKKYIRVFINPSEVSIAIGKNGSNIKLASKLTDYQIDIYRDDIEIEEEDDLYLTEFEDEIEPWVIEQLAKVGCETAQNVLRYSIEDLAERADLETETIEDLFKVIQEELYGTEEKEQ
ncbi:MAG: transcription termination factor NusA [Rikenellaceae bacterium]